MNKPSKLLSFARTSGRGVVQTEPAPVEEVIAPIAIPTGKLAKNALVGDTLQQKKDRIATNLRLTRDQWRRVHELALDEETTVQELAIRGLSRLFEERGLPSL